MTGSTSTRPPEGPAPLGDPWTPSALLVQDVRAALAGAPLATPEDRFEAWAWPRLLEECGPALLTRRAAPSHITASAIVLSPDARQTCLVLHLRMRAWVQPGGHLEDGDATLAGAAAREVLEETGLSASARARPIALSRHRAPCRPDVVDWHLDVQHLLVAAPSAPVVSHESLDVAWWPVDALPDNRAPGLARAVARAIRALEDERASP